MVNEKFFFIFVFPRCVGLRAVDGIGTRVPLERERKKERIYIKKKENGDKK